MPAHFIKLFVTVKNITNDDCHFRDEFPVLISRHNLRLGYDLRETLAFIKIKAFLAVFLNPFESLVIFIVVINLKCYSANNFGHINPFCTDAEIILEHIGITVAACNTHCNTAQVDVGLVFHPAYSH